MCVCGCSQILLECNHVGCTYSDRMRDELMPLALDRGENDDLTLQDFVQKYGPTVLAAPTAPASTGSHGSCRFWRLRADDHIYGVLALEEKACFWPLPAAFCRSAALNLSAFDPGGRTP